MVLIVPEWARYGTVFTIKLSLLYFVFNSRDRFVELPEPFRCNAGLCTQPKTLTNAPDQQQQLQQLLLLLIEARSSVQLHRTGGGLQFTESEPEPPPSFACHFAVR
ncbi:hypothetical protein ZHAS_00016494 [Anopheles sinensis]|uniref:Uncharacterized protein n=1 Tax=Anopheles sinensis TaxID=74873 RepID=A0A084WDS9_ANOSI|nr:hypothetical protein ZHAS_00016494 [Anopheles sinensis]